MKFLIQTYNGLVEHDFSHALIESCKFNNWLNNNDDYSYILSDNIVDDDKFIPIGSVEFVESYVKKFFNIDIKPINIPDELISFEYSGRKIINGTEKDIKGKCFIKSNDKIKSFTEITDNAPQGNYQISELVNFESEWRCFVYKNKLVGLQNYSGDFTLFPNVEIINSMINKYKKHPIAYTLDVGILDNKKTVVVEVHDFFSCGFYGFSDYKIIPQMFINWFREKIFGV